MRKQAAVLAIVMLAGVTGLANAQNAPAIKAEVPFQFEAKGMVMPAGECTIKAEGGGQTILTITSGRRHLIAVPNATESLNVRDETTLVFHKYGERYFLASIQRGGEARGYELPRSKVEAELQAQNVAEHDVTLVASLQ